MQKKKLLVELGLEEIPAGYILPALRSFKVGLEKELQASGLSYSGIEEYSTPRRLGLRVNDLETHQQDEVIERIGPQVNIAYDSEGNLTKAALGFLRGAKAEEKDVFKVSTPKGEKIAVKLEKKGKKVTELAKDMIRNAVNGITFPKTMRWGDTRMEFARPLRWLVCLLGDELLKIDINNVESGKTSYGSRFRKLVNPVEIDDACNYEAKLKEVEVIADREERKKQISDGMNKLCAEHDLELIKDDKLLETVADLVEYPTPVAGSFDEKYLFLPEKIIISTLSQNQKCYASRSKDGKLANKFIFTSNGNPEFEELIRIGNEKVISARLADAEFYYKEDTSQPLEAYVEKLRDVVFQKDLGTVYEKTTRIQALARYLGEQLNISEEEMDQVERCALLCKADLVTQMLGEKEFTKLQGYIGMNYALKCEEEEAVALGIYEHYMPRGQNDSLPISLTGTITAIADKLDTVCGIFGVDLVPTGSNDPFALRRAANGIVSIIAEKGFELNIDKMIEFSFKLLSDKLPKCDNNLDKVKDFLHQRINWYLKQEGIGYDVIESVMHIDHNNIPDILQRAIDVESFRKEDEFVSLVLGFKRVSNIISKEENFSEVEASRLQEPSEIKMWQAFIELDKELEQQLKEKNYKTVMERLVGFRSYIDSFFDDVMVNVDDEKLRKNRYNLLYLIRRRFLKVADLALVVVEDRNKSKKI